MPESNPRAATVRPVDEQEATGKVAEIFADIKRTKNIDFVPRFWRVIATNPAQLEAVWTTLKSLMHPEAAGRSSPLDPTTREIIALAVSATNGCPYCINSHTAALSKLGLDRSCPGRSHGDRGPLQHDQRAGQRLSGRARREAAGGMVKQ